MGKKINKKERKTKEKKERKKDFLRVTHDPGILTT